MPNVDTWAQSDDMNELLMDRWQCVVQGHVKIEDLRYEEIADAVAEATTAVAGPGKSIKDSPLSLKVCTTFLTLLCTVVHVI